MHRGIALGGFVLLGVVLCGVAVADEDWQDLVEDDDGAPYVDAGLDQEVVLGDEVLLDGGGTWDDQDDVTDREWTIETPDGDTIRPECPDCWFTRFSPNRTGRYDVTLTVRDAEGHENSDTLYVTVEEGEESPPAEPNESATDGSGGGEVDGCWVANSADGRPISHDICDSHGIAVDFEYSAAGDIESVVFENVGMADEYTGAELDYVSETVTVNMQIYKEEALDRWMDNKEFDASLPVNSGSIASDTRSSSRPTLDTTPSGGNAPGGGNTGFNTTADCNAPCGYYS